MYPLHLSFNGFAIIGLTLLILSLTILFYLLRLPQKSRATWLLSAFFASIALSGVATILTNAFFYWNRLFSPWQDFWVLAGGVALSQFAYTFPRNDQPREARITLVLLSGLALLALGYSIIFDYLYIFHWSPALHVSDAFYTLMPLGTALVIVIFLRRSIHFSALMYTTMNAESDDPPSIWQRLWQPQGKDAYALRSFALALTLGLLPGFGVLFNIPAPFSFLMQNVGSLLALAAIALVYFNYAPEMTSFMAKLVGITLTTVLLIFSVTGVFDYRRFEAQYYSKTLSALITAHALLLAESPSAIPAPVAYVAAWDADTLDEAAAYRQLFVRPDHIGFDLNTVVTESQRGWDHSLGRDLAHQTNESWQVVSRYKIYPTGSNQNDFTGYLFTKDNTVYEIGFSGTERGDFMNAVALKWMGLIVASSLFVLLFFPIFFQRTLVTPLANLLEGMRRVNDGDLNTAVPIRFHDEIGSLTDLFNTLTCTLKQSYTTLEQRVADRTRELSTFSELTMLSSSEQELSDTLQPALNRILEAGQCEALSLHLLAEDGCILHVAAHRYLPETAVSRQQTIPLTDVTSARIQRTDKPIITNNLSAQPDLPTELKIPQFQTYLGSPLSAGGQSHGWLSCYRTGDDGFGMSEASLLVALARQIGILVENHQLRQRIGQVAVFEERQRLARDLHDSVTQLLYSMTLFSRSGKEAMEDGDAPRLENSLNQISDTALQALRDMRALLFELQPPSLEKDGLAQALTTRFDIVERRVGIQVDFWMDASLAMPQPVEKEMYYVAIEALNNTLKHSGADEVLLTIAAENGRYQMIITDNGHGFDLARVAGGLGLQNMRQRMAKMGGDLEIETTVGGGVRITATSH